MIMDWGKGGGGVSVPFSCSSPEVSAYILFAAGPFLSVFPDVNSPA